MKLLLYLSFVIVLVSCSEKTTEPDDESDIAGGIKIGKQIWMQDNLAVKHYRNGDPIPNLSTDKQWSLALEGGWCFYNSDPATVEQYGLLYNWYAVNDPRGLAPEGWRVATDEDWKILETYIGMSEKDVHSQGRRGMPYGAKLAGDYDRWYSNIRFIPEFEETPFRALPSGFRVDDGEYGGRHYIGIWWTATWWSSTLAIGRVIGLEDGSIYRGYDTRRMGYSVRCVRDTKK